MPFQKSRSITLLLAVAATATVPAFAETDVKAIVLKHLKTSRDFTLKVAGQMPESSYDFKLTPPQMSFAEQMVHLSQSHVGLYFALLRSKAESGQVCIHEQERRARIHEHIFRQRYRPGVEVDAGATLKNVPE